MNAKINTLDKVIIKESASFLGFQYQPIYNSRMNSIQFYEVVSNFSSGFNDELYIEDINEMASKLNCIRKILFSKKSGVSGFVAVKINLSFLMDYFFVQRLLSFRNVNIAVEVCNLEKNIDSDTIVSNINLLQKSGIMVWLSDYHKNSEQANLSFGKISWDMIKVGKSFLYHNDFDATEALYYVLKPFTQYGLIFEGVETPRQAEIIRSIGEFGQGGFYCSS